MTRGIKHEVDRMISDLQAQYYPYEYKGQQALVQLAVRPIQLWELIMPEKYLGQVCRTLWGTNQIMQEQNNELNLRSFALRKMLGAQPTPKFDENILPNILYKANVAIYNLGIKPDVFNAEDGHEQL